MNLDHDQPCRSFAGRIALGAIACALGAIGCSEDKAPIAFDEISKLPVREELVEMNLGHFIIPVSMEAGADDEDDGYANLLQLKFDLVAIVDPTREYQVKQLMERHKGKIRDEVIRVCRNTARDDLLESEWATLKAHLLDAIQPLIGGQAIRRLATPTISRDEL